MARIVCSSVLLVLLTLCSANASTITPLVQLAQNHSEAGNHHAAYDTYWLAFRQDPGNIGINYNLGLEAAKIADYESAVMAFERVLLLDPNATQAKIELAKSFYQLGAVKTAKRYFDDVLNEGNLPSETKQNILLFLNKLN